jgi:alpha-glucosidase (family GH31 glycosyl hydrolase)
LSYRLEISMLFPQVVRTFREKGIPCDVVWMDIDYMDGFRCFTFDSVSTFFVIIIIAP